MSQDEAHTDDLVGWINARDDEHSSVADSREAPITIPDLIRYYRLRYPPETAEALIADLDPEPRPGESWSTDILIGIAQFSAEHDRRIRAHLGWSEERMLQERQAEEARNSKKR